MPETAQTQSGDSHRLAVWGGVECYRLGIIE